MADKAQTQPGGAPRTGLAIGQLGIRIITATETVLNLEKYGIGNWFRIISNEGSAEDWATKTIWGWMNRND